MAPMLLMALSQCERTRGAATTCGATPLSTAHARSANSRDPPPPPHPPFRQRSHVPCGPAEHLPPKLRPSKPISRDNSAQRGEDLLLRLCSKKREQRHLHPGYPRNYPNLPARHSPFAHCHCCMREMLVIRAGQDASSVPLASSRASGHASGPSNQVFKYSLLLCVGQR